MRNMCNIDCGSQGDIVASSFVRWAVVLALFPHRPKAAPGSGRPILESFPHYLFPAGLVMDGYKCVMDVDTNEHMIS